MIKNIIYLVKSYPIREYKIGNYIEKKYNNFKVTYVCFSQRNYLDLKNYDVNIINYIFFAKNMAKLNKDKKYYEEKLEEFSKKYNLDYEYILNCDRTLINRNNFYKIFHLYSLTRFALETIEKVKPYKVVGELSSSSDILFYKLSKYFNYNYLFFWHGRIKNRIAIENLEGKRLYLKKYYEELKKRSFNKDEEIVLRKYLENIYDKPDYENYNKKKKSLQINKLDENIFFRGIKWLKAYRVDKKYSADLFESINDKLYNIYLEKTFRFRYVFLKKYYDEVNYKDNYILVPLHYQPEASTMTFAQKYKNQLKHVKLLSENIPNEYKIYVKEHPSMLLNRKVNFYKELKKLKKVKIISAYNNTFELIKYSFAVVTLTNTTGYEAILLKKPVITFGDVFYNEYDYTYNIKNYDKLPELLEKIKSLNIDEKNYKAFIIANLKSLKIGNLNNHVLDKNVLDENNLKLISKIIINYDSNF